MVSVGEGVKSEPGEEVKKRRVEERTESGGVEFPLVPFLRRLNQIPTPPGPQSIPAKTETVRHTHTHTHTHTHYTCYARCTCWGEIPGFSPQVSQEVINALYAITDIH